jgi:hypothetical protein
MLERRKKFEAMSPVAAGSAAKIAAGWGNRRVHQIIFSRLSSAVAETTSNSYLKTLSMHLLLSCQYRRSETVPVAEGTCNCTQIIILIGHKLNL